MSLDDRYNTLKILFDSILEVLQKDGFRDLRFEFPVIEKGSSWEEPMVRWLMRTEEEKVTLKDAAL